MNGHKERNFLMSIGGKLGMHYYPTVRRGGRNDIKSGGPALMGSTRSGIRSEFYSSVLAAASFLKAFGIQTNGKWSLWYPILSKSVLNNMSL